MSLQNAEDFIKVNKGRHEISKKVRNVQKKVQGNQIFAKLRNL